MRENQYHEEINLRDLTKVIWRGKYFVIIFSVICLIAGVAYLRSSDPKYKVSLILAPVQEEQNTSSFGNLGGLASLAGISLPAGNASDFMKFEIMLTSEEISSQIFNDENIIRKLFASEWDKDQQVYRKPKQSKIKLMKDTIEVFSSGQPLKEYTRPSPAKLVRFVRKEISIKLDRKTKYLNISMTTSDPELLEQLLLSIIRNTDELFKRKFLKQAGDAVKFYQIKISKARSQEHRQILATLIGKEERKILLATREGPFVAEILTGPNTSLNPTSPKIGLILALSIFFGIFLSCGLILIINYLRKE